MMDDVVGLAGHKRHVESDAGLQIGREGPSDDPARPGVANDREVEKAWPASAGRGMSATHNAFGRSTLKLRRTRSLAGGWSLACRVVTGAFLRRLTPAIPAVRISRAIRFRPTGRPSAFSSGHEHTGRRRFHASSCPTFG